MQFAYRAFDEQGVITSGTIVAERREAAIEALYGSGLTPFEAREFTADVQDRSPPRDQTGRRPARATSSSGSRLDLRGLARFTVELSSLVGSGMALDEAFRVMAASDRGSVGRTAAALLKDVLAGAQLSEAMRSRPKTFGVDYCAIVTAGEGAGSLAPALAQIAELLARRLELRSKIAAALIYPAVLVVMSMVSVGVIIGVLVPSLTPVFIDAGLPLPGILAWFAWLEENASIIFVASTALVLVLVVLFNLISRSPAARLIRDRTLCKLPVLGRMLVLREGAAFARALGTLICARAPLMAALQTAQALILNSEIKSRCAAAVVRVPEGTPLSKAFAQAGLFPPAALSLITVGEESGQLGALLTKVANNLEGELQRRMERLVTMLTPVLTLAIGAGVGGLILQVMSAVLSINDLASR
jgi:general secretion pathway protein F